MTTAFAVFTQQAVIIGLLALSGWIAFSGIADKFRAGQLPKPASNYKEAARQILATITIFSALLYLTDKIISLGLSLRMIILVVCSLSIEQFTRNILAQTRINKTVVRVASISLAVAINYGWYCHPNWITIDLAALFMTVIFFVAYRDITVKQSVVLSLGIIGYDAIMVFGTGLMQKVASGVVAGGKASIPIIVMVPESLSPDSGYLFMFGLGDLVLPGLIIMAAIKQALRYELPSLAVGAYLGYFAGTIMSLAMLFIFKHPQPATIYLIPGVIVGFTVAAWRKGLAVKIISA